MTFETPIEQEEAGRVRLPTRPPMTLTETDKPEWQHLWESQHPRVLLVQRTTKDYRGHCGFLADQRGLSRHLPRR